MKPNQQELRKRLARLSPEQRAILEQRLGQLVEPVVSRGIVPYRGASRTFPVSFSQQRLWFVEQLESESAAYNICYAVRLLGELDLSALRSALRAVVERHEILRMVFVEEEGEPVQKIVPPGSFEIPLMAMEGIPLEQREGEARRLLNLGSRRLFRLDRWPLMDCSLLRLGEADHVLGLVLHHIISDGWSLKVMIRDLAMFYGAALGRGARPTPLPIQYKDFALWQRGLGEELVKQRRYWRKALAGVPTFLDLPTDRPRPETQGFSGARHPFTFSPEASAALRSLAQGGEGITQFMALFAAFQILLSYLGRQEAFAVSTPLSYRNRAEFEGLIGFFVNTVLFPVDLSGDPTVGEILSRVRAVVLGAYAHQDVPLEAVIQEVAPDRALSYSPFLQVSINFIHSDLGGVDVSKDLLRASGDDHAGAGLGIEEFEFDDATNALVELGLVVSSEGEQLRGSLHYKTDLFEVSTIETFIDQYQQILIEAASTPMLRCSALCGLLARSEEERRAREQERLQRMERPGLRRGRRSAVALPRAQGAAGE